MSLPHHAEEESARVEAALESLARTCDGISRYDLAAKHRARAEQMRLERKVPLRNTRTRRDMRAIEV